MFGNISYFSLIIPVYRPDSNKIQLAYVSTEIRITLIGHLRTFRRILVFPSLPERPENVISLIYRATSSGTKVCTMVFTKVKVAT